MQTYFSSIVYQAEYCGHYKVILQYINYFINNNDYYLTVMETLITLSHTSTRVKGKKPRSHRREDEYRQVKKEE